MYNFDEINEFVKQTLSEKRYYHSMCTAKQCEELAKMYKIDTNKAKLIGMTHDIAREMSEKEKLEYIKKNNIGADQIELSRTVLLHAKIGADICKKKFGFSTDMLDAIRAHTTGKVDMDLLSKILFVADVTGDDREWDVKFLRNIAKKDIDLAVIYTIDETIKKKLEKQKTIHPDTIFTRNSIILQRDYI